MDVSKFNPYELPKDDRIANDPRFNTLTQAQIYQEIYLVGHKYRAVSQHYINVDFMRKNSDYFGEALSMCEEFGLLPLMQFSCHYIEDLITQFYTTVHMETNEERTLTWMTNDRVMTAPWKEFAAAIGYPENGASHPSEFHVHLMENPMKKDVLAAHHYIVGRGIAGQQADLLPTYDILHRVFREVVNPKVGNFDEIHGFLVNLLFLAHEMKGQAIPLDVSDFIWHEMMHAVLNRKDPPFAPYVMQFLINQWGKLRTKQKLVEDPCWTPQEEKTLLIKKHKAPRFGYEEAAPEDEPDDSNDSDYEIPPRPKNGWFARIEKKLKKTFCLVADNHRREWEAHRDSKAIRSNQKKMMRKMELVCISGSEDKLTSFSKWQSKHYKWDDEQDDASSSCQPAPEE